MFFTTSMTALAVLATVAEVQAKAVFAHYMVGNSSDMEARGALTQARLGSHLVISRAIGVMTSPKPKPQELTDLP